MQKAQEEREAEREIKKQRRQTKTSRKGREEKAIESQKEELRLFAESEVAHLKRKSMPNNIQE